MAQREVPGVKTQIPFERAPGRPAFPRRGILAALPNPSHGQVLVGFALPEAGVTVLSLSDLTGAVVGHWPLGDLVAGEHALSLDLDGRSPGLYFLSLQLDCGKGAQTLAIFKVALVR